MFEPQERAVKRPTTKSKKRKTPEPEDSYAEESEPEAEVQDEEKPRVKKVRRVESEPTDVRRSSRISGKKVDYTKEIVKGSPVPVAYSSGVKTAKNEGPMGRDGGRRMHDP